MWVTADHDTDNLNTAMSHSAFDSRLYVTTDE